MARSSGLSLVMHNKRDDRRPPEERQCDFFADSRTVKKTREKERKKEKERSSLHFNYYVSYFPIACILSLHFLTAAFKYFYNSFTETQYTKRYEDFVLREINSTDPKVITQDSRYR